MAVLAADVVGNGRLVVSDEEAPPALWKTQWRELIDPRILEYGGRVGRITGHPPLVEFKSVIAAVRCAVEVQRTMLKRNAGALHKRPEFRVGINVGDVIADGADMWGIAVNIAMRAGGAGEAWRNLRLRPRARGTEWQARRRLRGQRCVQAQEHRPARAGFQRTHLTCRQGSADDVARSTCHRPLPKDHMRKIGLMAVPFDESRAAWLMSARG